MVDGLGEATGTRARLESTEMASSSPIQPPLDLVIDLTDMSDLPTGHRLTELVQAITGCSAERAELAVSDPAPMGPATSDDALRTMARAIVRLRPRQPA